MNASEQPTCGKGLAENSVLPERLGQLLAAMAENLAAHMKALDPTNPSAGAEYDAYEGLVKDLQQVAAELDAVAVQMAGYRDLPMAPHDEKAMTHPRVLAAFQSLVRQKQELSALLEETMERDHQLLETIRAHSS